MGFFYNQKTGARGAIYDEGNNIILMPLGGRINRQMIISRDYGSELIFYCDTDRVYIAYFNTQNDLVWHTVGEGERVILLSGTIEGLEISNIKIEKIYDAVYLFYVIKKLNNNQYEIRYISPFGNRNSKTFFCSEYPIENYGFSKNNEWYLSIKLLGECTTRQYMINIDKIGDVKFEEFKLYNVDELQKNSNNMRLLEEEVLKYKNYINRLEKDLGDKNAIIEEKDESLHKAQEVYNNMLKNEINKIETQYRKQYDELAKLTKEIQEEGKRWRELYYKNVKK